MARRTGFAVVLVATLVVAAFAAAPAGAATNKTKYCAAMANVGSEIGGSSSTKSQAAAIQKGLKKAAGYASGNLKSATNTLADFYGKVAKGSVFSAVVRDLGTKYAKAVGTIGNYMGSNCQGAPTATAATSGATTTTTGNTGGTTTTVVGSQLACSADRAILDGAEAAYFAFNRHYTDMATLVSAGILPSASTLHTITLTGTPANATAYTVNGC